MLKRIGSKMTLEVVVLAAGAGTRMRSALPKVLHPLGGRPLLAHVLVTAASLEPRRIHVVVGEQSEEVRARFADEAGISWVVQEQRRGSGHAVAQALPLVEDSATVLVLYGDVPFMETETLCDCVQGAGEGVALVTVALADPHGFGRILRDVDGAIIAIVEERDATDGQRAIPEVNTGVLAAPAAILKDLVANLTPENVQGEYYLTDVVSLAKSAGIEVVGVEASPEESLGVNDRAQLANLERIHQRRQAARLMAGASLSWIPPASTSAARCVPGGTASSTSTWCSRAK